MLGLSLLRAPTNPAPQADRGKHRFTYALPPHVRLYEAWGQCGPTVVRWDATWGAGLFVSPLEDGPDPLAPPVTHSEAGQLEFEHRPYDLYTIATEEP